MVIGTSSFLGSWFFGSWSFSRRRVSLFKKTPPASLPPARVNHCRHSDLRRFPAVSLLGGLGNGHFPFLGNFGNAGRSREGFRQPQVPRLKSISTRSPYL